MKIKIVGVQSQDYRMDNGYAFKGEKIHALDLETRPEGLTGCQVMNFKIAAGSPLSDVPLVVGNEYTVFFNQKGGLDYIAPCQ